MKTSYFILLATVALGLSSCKKNNTDDDVVSQRYIHKYGYALSQQEWEAKDFPGQVITNLRNGVTVTSTYENGVLHGPTTYTFPHSQTVEHYFLYNEGTAVKEIVYSVTGMPAQEKIQLSPTRYSVTEWYAEGTPRFVEEYVGQELLEGQYYTTQNEVESRVEKGQGLRVLRDSNGVLLAKEAFKQGFPLKKETFYPNGCPESVALYSEGFLHGPKKTFAIGGEPLAVEEYVNGYLHGKCTYFENGNRFLEIPYLYGQKNGKERRYLDGEVLSQEISWENDLLHGPTTYFVDGEKRQEWFYAGQKVNQRKFEEFDHLDQIVSNDYPNKQDRPR